MLSLTYISSTTHTLAKDELAALVRRSRARNEQLGVTGMILHTGGHVIQTLEGPNESVDALFTLIDADPRHRSAFIVRREEIERREFTAWFMGYREISQAKAATIPGFTDYVRTGAIDGHAARRCATATSHRVFCEHVA